MWFNGNGQMNMNMNMNLNNVNSLNNHDVFDFSLHSNSMQQGTEQQSAAMTVSIHQIMFVCIRKLI